MPENAHTGPGRPGGAAEGVPDTVGVVDAAHLLRGAREVVIRHAGQTHRLKDGSILYVPE